MIIFRFPVNPTGATVDGCQPPNTNAFIPKGEKKKTMKENKTHTVIWIKQDDPTCEVHESPNMFSKQRANELSEMANEEFKSSAHMAVKGKQSCLVERR